MRFLSSRDSFELSCLRHCLELCYTRTSETWWYFVAHTRTCTLHARSFTFYRRKYCIPIPFVTCAFCGVVSGQVDTTCPLPKRTTIITVNKMDLERLKTLLNCTLYQPQRSDAEIQLQQVSIFFDTSTDNESSRRSRTHCTRSAS